MAATFNLDDDVRDVLKRSTISAKFVTLPEQLERKLYEKVNKVLASAGGKWERRAKAHVFAEDPRIALGLAVVTGVAVNQQQLKQAFYTPPEIARLVVAHLALRAGDTILEPSAGHGALLHALRGIPLDLMGGLVVVEQDPGAANVLRADGYTVHEGDFLAFTPKDLGTFDRIVMNPPFHLGADIKHVKHALGFLKRGGRLVSIVGNGPNQAKTFRPIRTDWIDLPAGSFKEAGTNVNTAIIVIDNTP